MIKTGPFHFFLVSFLCISEGDKEKAISKKKKNLLFYVNQKYKQDFITLL